MNYLFKTKPYKHQLDVFETSKDMQNYALFMEMGTGKSKVVIDNAAYLYEQGKITALFIIAPKGAYLNWWYNELPAHMPDRIPVTQAYWTAGARKWQHEMMDALFDPDDKNLKILIMNVEALATKKGQDFAYKFLVVHEVFMTLDESTTIKNEKAKRSKAAIRLGKMACIRRILSGEPIVRSPLDIYNQCAFLDRSLLGFSTFFGFRNQFAIIEKQYISTHSFDKVVGFQRLDELQSLLKQFSARILKSECLDLPDKVYTIRYMEMEPEQKRLYKEMKEQALIELSQFEIVTAPLVMTKMLKLHQIVCGFITNNEGKVTHISDVRMKIIREVLDEAPGKVIIWAAYRHNIRQLEKSLGEHYGKETVASFYGETPNLERQEIVKSFQDPHSTLRYFISHPRTGGFGITLTQATTVIYYANSYDLEARIQSEDRAHRIGQTSKVVYVDIICKGTVDEHITKNLRDKKNIAEVVMNKGWDDLF